MVENLLAADFDGMYTALEVAVVAVAADADAVVDVAGRLEVWGCVGKVAGLGLAGTVIDRVEWAHLHSVVTDLTAVRLDVIVALVAVAVVVAAVVPVGRA
jgi:hypothetical protein